MREEWLDVDDRARTGPSSWTWSRLVGVGITAAIAALVIGIGSARLLGGSGAAAVDPPVRVEGAVESADGEPATEIGDAVAVERDGDGTPAADGHLIVTEVSVSTCGGREHGSGFVVADGLLATAAHVVGEAGTVRIDHRGQTVTGEVLGVLADGRDVALVALDAPLDAPPPVGPPPPPGAAVTIVGHPEAGPRTSVVGEVVAVAPEVARAAGGGTILGVDAAVREGMSGGPALDAAGGVVGMVVARETATDTALVVTLPDLADLAGAPLAEGACPTDA